MIGFNDDSLFNIFKTSIVNHHELYKTAMMEGMKLCVEKFAYWKDGIKYIGDNITVEEAIRRIDEGK